MADFVFIFCHDANTLAGFSVFRMSGLGWVIILRGHDGREYTMKHAHLSFNDSSVTVMWYSKAWPPLATLSTLDLCGVTPVFMGQPRTPTRIRYVLGGKAVSRGATLGLPFLVKKYFDLIASSSLLFHSGLLSNRKRRGLRIDKLIVIV